VQKLLQGRQNPFALLAETTKLQNIKIIIYTRNMNILLEIPIGHKLREAQT